MMCSVCKKNPSRTVCSECREAISEENVTEARNVILDAEIVNKGIYAHKINSLMGTLKIMLKTKPHRTFGTKEFNEMIKVKWNLMGFLYRLRMMSRSKNDTRNN